MSFSLQGIPAAGGIALENYVIYDPTPPLIPSYQILYETMFNERMRLQQAIEQARTEMSRLRDHIQVQIGKTEADIFDAHLMLLEDEALLEGAYMRIEEQLMNAEQAVWETTEEYAQLIIQQEDSYFQARANDLYDIRIRIVNLLQGRATTFLHTITEAKIIVARDLLPSDTASLNPVLVRGLITELGGPTSHTAILARQLGIPAIVGVPNLISTLQTHNQLSTCIALNGETGIIEIDSDESMKSKYLQALDLYQQKQQDLQSLRTKPAITQDGFEIEVAANIGRPQDAADAREEGADGIGLFRTEFLFLDRKTPPDEEEQFFAYHQVLQTFAGKTVIVRTLDIGGDKSIAYLDLAQENNPFLGLRGIRLCLAEAQQDLFQTQIRALLRAVEAASAPLWIMFPMICDLRELRKAKACIKQTEDVLLKEHKLQHEVRSLLRIGVMIETPAAALSVDLLAREADFFSIGTNDLAQYTLASDRTNASLAELHLPFHPAVMRSIATIITEARKQKRWVGMCGEMAGDPRASTFLLGLGINELSMEPTSLNAVKAAVRATTMSQAQALIQQVLQAESSEEVEQILTK